MSPAVANVRTVLVGVLVGAALGAILSVAPIVESAVVFVAGCAAVIFFAAAFRLLRRVGRNRTSWSAPRFSRHHAVSLFVGVVVAGTVMAAAVRAPCKFLDREVGPFSSSMTLRDVEAALSTQGVHVHYREGNRVEREAVGDLALKFPARPMRIRALFQQIETQTGLTVKIGYCGDGVSLLYGAEPITISLSKRSDP